MKFLVILTALLINHYWTRDRFLAGDAWFERLLATLQRATGSLSHPEQWFVVSALLVPAGALLGLLWIVDGVLLGLISFCVHVALLLVLFDPRPLRTWVQEYLSHWRAGDYEAAYLFMGERGVDLRLDSSDDLQAVHAQCIRFLLSTSFERLFAVLFWYLVLGPAGALVYYALTQLRRSQAELGIDWLVRLEYVLEWVPARLLGLTFALAGQFETTFKSLRGLALDAGSSARELVLTCASAAIGKARETLVVHDSEEEGVYNTVVIDMEGEGEPLTAEQYAQEVEDFLALIDRSQIIWISALAILALYGIGG